jgi:hypothetical protein
LFKRHKSGEDFAVTVIDTDVGVHPAFEVFIVGGDNGVDRRVFNAGDVAVIEEIRLDEYFLSDRIVAVETQVGKEGI